MMFVLLMAFLAAQRLLELVLAERNRRWAIEQGGKESGRRHYPLIVGMHVCFYLSLVLEHAYVSPGWNSLWPLWLGIFLLAQGLRLRVCHPRSRSGCARRSAWLCGPP